MSRVKRTQQNYDAELQAQGLCRTYRPETVQHDKQLATVWREVTMKIAELQDDMTPWWKKTKKTRSKK